MSDFVVGELVRVSSVFTDSAGAAADPTAVLFKYKNPEGTVTSPTPTKDSTGHYHVDINVSQHGTWHWRSYATGTGQAAEEGSFTVGVSEFS